MPGMMDTILNLGLNDASVEGLAKKTGNPRFAYDCYRRFVQMFCGRRHGACPRACLRKSIDKMKAAKGVTNDVDLDADDLKQLVVIFKKPSTRTMSTSPSRRTRTSSSSRRSRPCSAAGITRARTSTAR